MSETLRFRTFARVIKCNRLARVISNLFERNLMRIGICGAGTMGRGIAIATAQAGIECRIFDPSTKVMDACMTAISDTFNKAVQKQKMSAEEADEALVRCNASTSLSEMADCDLVIEAIVELPDAKNTLFRELESIVTDNCILATNTSSIAIASLSRHLRCPQRFIGLHFFNPANIMKLVEIIRAPQTTDDVVKIATEFSIHLGKSPAIARDVPGFIVNRVARNFYNESQRIVTEGAATITQVDTIMKSAGFKMGPFELMDLIGVDVNLSVTKSMYEQYFYEPRFQPSGLQQYYVDAGLHGRKTGRGFYDYTKST